MTFWSSQSLEAGLQGLVGHADHTMVDCNSITLRIGSEIYISPNMTEPSPATHTKRILKPREGFTIPPGQFGFLLTEETIAIPLDVMGLISIKATYKLMGLINVSGFHVDPGWCGQLIYSVFNAGPAPIHLQQGMPLFLLWVASLDDVSHKRKHASAKSGIPPTMINNITGVIGSVADVEKRVNDRLDAVIATQATWRDELIQVERRVGGRQERIISGLAFVRVLFGAIGAIALVVLGAYFATVFPELVKVPELIKLPE